MGIRLSSILIGGMLCILSTSLIAGPNSGTESAAGAAVHAAANRRAEARYYATMVQGTATMRAYFEHLQREIPVDASGDTEARLRLRLASYLTSSPKQSHELAAILLSLGQAERETQFWLLHVFFVQAAGAQDLSAMAEIAKTMLKDFPSAEAGLRMTLTQAILAEDWKGSAEALIALLGDGTWSKASGTSFGYSKGLRLPKD
ncbi:MAG: hypothetical protein KDB07_06065, partial [Planctomycetes bacterium]|nr:hypothetical protein [Planctomycetota bacterium]